MDLVAFVVIRLVEVYLMVIATRRILTWFEVDPDHFLARVLDAFVEPVLAPIRRVVPPAGTRDTAPLVAITALFVTWLVLRVTLGGDL